MITNSASGTNIQEIAADIYRINTPVSISGTPGFSFNTSPNRYGLGPFYELHVWAWKKNKKGAFADMNPDVSCDAATK